jgi:hypothetical protein
MTTAFSRILRNVDNLDVTDNEYKARQTLQRIVDRLYQNDLALEQFYADIFGGFYIKPYDATTVYEYGQLVWYRCEAECASDKLREPGKGLHVLRYDSTAAAQNTLSRYPKMTFEQLGWKDLNPDMDVLAEYGIKKVMQQYVTKQFKLHQSDESLHPYGRLSYDPQSQDVISAKLMNRDFGNADPEREQTFFPYETIYLVPNDQVLDGYGRCYDNGLLEFDIVFRLSYAGYREIDWEYGVSADTLSCNSYDARDLDADSAYFYSNNDADIFRTDGGVSSDLGESVEYGRNDYCNVYTATVRFAQDSLSRHRFADAGYMIFGSDVMCQDRDTKYGSVNVGANQMTFAGKTETSFVAVYVTYPNQQNFTVSGYNASHGGLMQNSFHCHVVGRWK